MIHIIDLDFMKKLPGHSGPRILSLDGGGVRGIVLVRILERIEKMTGYKVCEYIYLYISVHTDTQIHRHTDTQ
jgi:calcium-independent phospholipase A2-gamma